MSPAQQDQGSGLSIGALLYDNLTQLDLTGPLEIFARMPGASVHLLARSMAPVSDDHGVLRLRPTATFHNCPPLDMIFVPGGPGQIEVMADTDTLDFLNAAGSQARIVSSVCTGSLILAAAGLLRGYRATCHWSSLDQLSILGAIPISERVVIDRNRYTGAGVTAGLDLGFALVSRLYGSDAAEEMQLAMEYDPQPATRAGSPKTAHPDTLARVRARSIEFLSQRRKATRQAKARLERYHP